LISEDNKVEIIEPHKQEEDDKIKPGVLQQYIKERRKKSKYSQIPDIPELVWYGIEKNCSQEFPKIPIHN
jgi:hypothetical protein